MQRRKVESSCIAAVGYDAAEQMLEIEFTSGKVYVYLSVPASVHRGLLDADSHGRYFNHLIRGRYSYRRAAD